MDQKLENLIVMKESHTYNSLNHPHKELGEVEHLIRSHIGWALNNKDRNTLFSTIINTDELFYYQTDSKSTITGISEFRKLIDEFMREDFKAISVDIRQLRIHISSSLKTAWFSCILDDYNEFQGRPFVWENVRWTGVLEKIEGEWKIFQMHFSKAEDLVEKSSAE